jgi:hypothetical protein
MEQAADDRAGKDATTNHRCKQWLAMTRVRGQKLAMAAKGGSGQRRDCHGKKLVIAALVVAEASWIWATKMHVA